jgi:hypothetical protein
MATYDYYKEYQSGMNAPKANGTFWLYAKIDFSKQNMAQNDSLKLFQIKDKWVFMRGMTRTTVATDGNTTCDIGNTLAGQQFDVAADPFAAGDWVTMSVLTGTTTTWVSQTADGYVYLKLLDAAASSGIFEVAMEVYVGLDDGEGTDSLAE